MCMVDGGERADVWVTQSRRARKAHVCSECARTIAAREEYLHVSGLQDGHWFGGKICAHCQIGARWLLDNCGGYMLHGIQEDVAEHVSEYRPHLTLGLGRLVIGARRQWRRFDGSGLMEIPAVPTGIKEFVAA